MVQLGEVGRLGIALGERGSPMLAAQHEVAAEGKKINRANQGGGGLKNQPVARLRILDRIEQKIGLVQRLARKENLGDETVQPAGTKNREVNVRRPPPPLRFRHGIRAGLEGTKPVAALGVGNE